MTTAPAIAAARATVDPTATHSSIVDLSDRLVWAELPEVDNAEVGAGPAATAAAEASTATTEKLWPALIFKDIVEFDSFVLEEAQASPPDVRYRYRPKLAMLIMERHQQQEQQQTRIVSNTPRVVRFLGRPLDDVQVVCDGEYWDYVCNLHQMLTEKAYQPDKFQGSFQRYMDFHRGLDQAMNMIRQAASSSVAGQRPDVLTSVGKARKIWIDKFGSLPNEAAAEASNVPAAAAPANKNTAVHNRPSRQWAVQTIAWRLSRWQKNHSCRPTVVTCRILRLRRWQVRSLLTKTVRPIVTIPSTLVLAAVLWATCHGPEPGCSFNALVGQDTKIHRLGNGASYPT